MDTGSDGEVGYFEVGCKSVTNRVTAREIG